MQIIDTHNHIYLPEFDADRDEVVKRSVDDGVRTILMPNIDSSSVAPMLAAEERYPGVCLPMMGLHPTSVKENYLDELELVVAALREHKYYGIGETGIDLYWDRTFVKEQVASFRRHLELAERLENAAGGDTERDTYVGAEVEVDLVGDRSVDRVHAWPPRRQNAGVVEHGVNDKREHN